MFLNDICPSYLFVLLERSPPCIVVYMSRAVNPQWPLKRLITYSQTTIKEFDRLMAAGRLQAFVIGHHKSEEAVAGAQRPVYSHLLQRLSWPYIPQLMNGTNLKGLMYMLQSEMHGPQPPRIDQGSSLGFALPTGNGEERDGRGPIEQHGIVCLSRCLMCSMLVLVINLAGLYLCPVINTKAVWPTSMWLRRGAGVNDGTLLQGCAEFQMNADKGGEKGGIKWPQTFFFFQAAVDQEALI